VLDLLGTEGAGLAQPLAGARVQVGDVAAAVGDHERLLAALVRAPPVIDQSGAGRVGGRGGDEAAVLVVLAGESGDVAATEVRERLAVPLLVLATDLVQLGGADLIGQGAEGTAGLDLGKLAAVAHEHKLGLGVLSRFGERGQIARADHPGLVDDEDAAALELRAVIERVP
jgi:hypothetical protein